MKYRDLIQFDPIKTVIVIGAADELQAAQQLVKTYVFSTDMATRVIHAVLPRLDYIDGNDSKSIFVVGNYGTGKSHFMSVISAVCENASLLTLLNNRLIAEHPILQKISGTYKVIRTEIGAVKTPLKDIIFKTLIDNLQAWGITYQLPSEPQISNKHILKEMITAFTDTYPDKALLVVVDELLDYLRSRDDQELILDLGFLREVGEIAGETRLRFMAGVQEQLFDSVLFERVSDSLRRVRDRFEQVMIVRDDIQYVVKERLLHKTPEQKERIRDHLAKFSKYYATMQNSMHDFVDLFPIHPDFIKTFETLRHVERREALRTYSTLMERHLDDEVPSDAPGVFSYDTYWHTISENPVLRATPSIKNVMQCAETISGRIASLNQAKQPYARRLVHALTIQRLSTPDINTPIGVTSRELRDSLCLFNPSIAEMGGSAPEDDLRTYIDGLLKDMSRAVNNQFLTHNTVNDQWYLDVNKNEDFDANIRNRAESLDAESLNRAYNRALLVNLELTDTPSAFTGYNIWQYELPWTERNSGRAGYLFFGSPNQRATAVPAKEYYVYFLQPYEKQSFTDEQRADEVFVTLGRRDAEFDEAVRLAAAATALSSTSSGQSKSIYDNKVREYNLRIATWMTAHMLDAFSVTHQGRVMQINSWLRERSKTLSSSSDAQQNFRDVMRSVASHCLNQHFVASAPLYPRFTVLLTAANRQQATREALTAVAGQNRTTLATAVLNGLKLFRNERPDVTESPYAQHIIDLLKAKGAGQVINHSEIFVSQNGTMLLLPESMRLEPEFVMVVLAVLIYAGYIEVDVAGTKYDATKLTQFANVPMNELINFKHLKSPQDYNIPAMQELMLLLNLPPAYAQSIANGGDGAVTEVQTKIHTVVNDILKLNQSIQSGLLFWGRDVVQELGFANAKAQLTAYKEFLERLTNLTTPQRFKNLPAGSADIQHHHSAVQTMRTLVSVLELTSGLTQHASWLQTAAANLDSTHSWQQQYAHTRDAVIDTIAHIPTSATPVSLQSVLPRVTALKNDYITAYIQLHNSQRLTGAAAQRKQALAADPHFGQLNALAAVDILPRQQLVDIQSALNNLKVCHALTHGELEAMPLCPDCAFRPLSEASHGVPAQRLELIEQQLDTLQTAWIHTVLENLDDPTSQSTLAMLDTSAQQIVRDFMQTQKLPDQDIDRFAQVLNETFRGFMAKRISLEEIVAKLRLADGAVSPVELKRRFNLFVDQLSTGHDPERVRIVLDNTEHGKQ